jgi:hypothetical protein
MKDLEKFLFDGCIELLNLIGMMIDAEIEDDLTLLWTQLNYLIGKYDEARGV